MSFWIDKVAAFHNAIGAYSGDKPHMPDYATRKLRADLIAEEAEETIRALEEGDLVEAVDGICDLVYVALGAALALGVDLDPCFDEVHRSNLSKLGAGKSPEGKQLKGPNYSAPCLATILRRQGWEGK